MRPEDFDYALPAALVAQEPAPRRDASRLMTVDGATGAIAHHRFTDLPTLLRAGDLIVLNDTRVRPARLHGRRGAAGSGGRVEALLIERIGGTPERPVWRAMLKGGREGDVLSFGPHLSAVVTSRADEIATLELSAAAGGGPLDDLLARQGRMPLPPYIRREPDDPRETMDRERYQTIFASVDGAVAAPTASLHFTPEVMESIGRAGIATASLTLHVGPGTFQPVRSARVEDHTLLPERCIVPPAAAGAVALARARRGRVVAAGTTVTRALESRARDDGGVAAGESACDLFILPGHRFRVVDRLLTNLHLPRSTLLMLVSAFAGWETIRAAYEEAIREGYRFHSYGDAMLIAPRLEGA
jgi:S-adenosylmethionine:tRNA ribosyltransferase-isomerase